MATAGELAVTYYNAARAEILQRIALREQVLLAGITAFGAIAGLAVTIKTPALLNFFPVLSLALAIVLFRHHLLIIDLGIYIHNELTQYLEVCDQVAGTGTTALPRHWDRWLQSSDASHHRSENLSTVLWFELTGAWLLIWAPGAGALGYLWLVAHRAVMPCLQIPVLLFALWPFAKDMIRLLKHEHQPATP